MVKKTILIFLGPESKKSNNEFTKDLLQECLEDDYNIIVPDIEYNDMYSVRQQLESLTEDKDPEILIGVDFGCFFVHQMTGYDRVCINPTMSILECGDYQCQLSDDELNEYMAAEARQYAYNRSEDLQNDTHCWGIYPSDCLMQNKHFSMLYYPQIITKSDTTITEDFIYSVLSPLLENISRSSYTDECGVRFRNYGRTIVGVDYVIFNSGVEDYEVPQGVTSICPESFSSTNLRRLKIPSSVQTIGKAMCMGCSDLEEIVFESPSRLGVIPESCFAECESLTHISLPQSVFSIQESAFKDSAIEEITVNGDLQYMHRAFDGCGKVYIKMKANKVAEMLDELHKNVDAEYKQFRDENPIEDDGE